MSGTGSGSRRRGGRSAQARTTTPSAEPPSVLGARKLSDDYKHELPAESYIHGWDMHFTLTLVVWVILGATAWMAYQSWNRLDGDTRKAVEAATGVTSCTLATVAATLLCCTGFCFGGRLRRRLHLTPRPRALEKYAAVGLGSTSGASPADLYLDMVKRTVVNIIYQDSPQWLYDNRKQPFVSDAGFDLEYRVRGEDVPRTAHTMTGLVRLNNVQQLVTDVVRRGVPGDLIETGVYRGGTTVFMKACLRALGAEDRQVFVCDTFQPQGDPPTLAAKLFFIPLARLLASIPGRPYRRWFFDTVQKLTAASDVASFPVCEDASDNSVDVVLFVLRHAGHYAPGVGTSLDEVKETFVKYGLLDDKVKFLRGFFSDTLPKAPIEKLSVIRLDGDTYESTMTAIEPLYPKLQVGGYVIVDDYNSLSDCQKAIDDYREKHGITDPLVPIDNLSVYWQRTQ